MDERVIATIVGMSFVTYIPRLLPILLLAGRSLPRPVLEWLRLLPPAILGAFVVQQVFVHDGRLDLSFTNPTLVPALVTLLIAVSTRNLAWTVLGGLAAASLYNVLL